MRIDYELLKEKKEKEYLSFLEMGFKKFPEKAIVFHAPILALYFVLGGYERMNILQLFRLTGIFHKFVHLLLSPRGGLVKLGKEIEKITVLSKR